MVLRHQIDTNHHMNNAQYVDMGERGPAENRRRSGRSRAEYKKAAVLGDEVRILLGETDSGWACSLCAESGDVYANVELRRK